MSKAADTVALIADGGGTTVMVKRPVPGYSSTRATPKITASLITTLAVFIDPKINTRAEYERLGKGEIARATHTVYCPQTSTVLSGDRLYVTGANDFYEVLRVRPYEGHKELDVEMVEARV
jgi:hypothetical protein